MDRLTAWWRSWKQYEADASRATTPTFAYVVTASIFAGYLWLPDPVSRSTVLLLAMTMVLITMGMYWITVQLVMEWHGVSWRNPVVSGRNLVLSFFLGLFLFVGVSYLLYTATGSSINWGVLLFQGLVASLFYLGVIWLRSANTRKRGRE